MLQKLQLKNVTVMTVDQMKNISGGKVIVCNCAIYWVGHTTNVYTTTEDGNCMTVQIELQRLHQDARAIRCTID